MENKKTRSEMKVKKKNIEVTTNGEEAEKEDENRKQPAVEQRWSCGGPATVEGGGQLEAEN